jgi:alpha-L-fucosidase
MNHKDLISAFFLCFGVAFAGQLTSDEQTILAQAEASREARMAWFKAARFGMFIHWGDYAVPARGEWVLDRERIPIEEYTRYAAQFQPTAYNPDEWVSMAQQAGMKYMVLTSRHHDGYCLWDTKTTDWNAVKTGPRRDLFKAYVEACRRKGMRVGFYYSIADWRHPDWIRGMRLKDDAAMARFGEYVRAQLRELLTRYGTIDILWFDGTSGRPERWNAASIMAMAWKINPDLIINNRSGLPGDWDTPEQELGRPKTNRYWESCFTLNDNWGYSRYDKNYKSVKTIISMIQHAVQYKGNVLLNVGPMADGRFPPESVAKLKELAGWMRINGDAVVKAGPSPLQWSNYGNSTAGPSEIYLMVYYWPGQTLALAGLKNRILSAQILGSDRRITVEPQKTRVLLRGLPPEPPDPNCTVIKLVTDGTPAADYSYQGWPFELGGAGNR